MTSYIKYITIVVLFVSSPAFSKSLNSFDAWIPSGWKLISTTIGDLNQDGIEDAVLVLEETNPANLKSNTALGPSVLNVNPRRLLVLLKTHSTYRKILSQDNLLPSEGNEDNPCLVDPLMEEKEEARISIRSGKLVITLETWLSCGSYEANHKTFTFRLENTRFRLIGYDYLELFRNSGEASECSINYLTGKKKTTTGLGRKYFEDKTSKPEESWSRIANKKKFYLDKIILKDWHDCGWDQ